MPAATHDIFIEQGATYRLQLIHGRNTGTVDVNGDPVVDPYDLTGVIARMQIRPRRDGTVLLSASTTDGGITIPDPTTGRIIIEFSAAQTDTLTVRRAKYDLEIEYPSGDVIRLIEGAVTISPNITRPVTVPEEQPT